MYFLYAIRITLKNIAFARDSFKNHLVDIPILIWYIVSIEIITIILRN